MRAKKLYYTPGLISIIGLPVLLFFFGPEDPVLRYSTQLFLPYDKSDSARRHIFSKDYIYDEIKNKKIVSIDLDDGRDIAAYEYDGLLRYNFQKKDQFISHEIERLQFTNDTSTVLRVGLGQSNTYGDFIWVLDNAILYRMRWFAFMDNSFYLFANKPIDHSPEMNIKLPAGVCCIPVMNEKKFSKWNLFKETFIKEVQSLLTLIRQNYFYLVGFTLLIFIPALVRIIKRNDSQAVPGT